MAHCAQSPSFILHQLTSQLASAKLPAFSPDACAEALSGGERLKAALASSYALS